MMTMLEKVARAICEAAIKDGASWIIDDGYLLDEDSNTGVRLEALARAAIEALMNPTEKMESAYWTALAPMDCYRAMLIAALEGKP